MQVRKYDIECLDIGERCATIMLRHDSWWHFSNLLKQAIHHPSLQQLGVLVRQAAEFLYNGQPYTGDVELIVRPNGENDRYSVGDAEVYLHEINFVDRTLVFSLVDDEIIGAGTLLQQVSVRLNDGKNIPGRKAPTCWDALRSLGNKLVVIAHVIDGTRKIDDCRGIAEQILDVNGKDLQAA